MKKMGNMVAKGVKMSGGDTPMGKQMDNLKVAHHAPTRVIKTNDIHTAHKQVPGHSAEIDAQRSKAVARDTKPMMPGMKK